MWHQANGILALGLAAGRCYLPEEHFHLRHLQDVSLWPGYEEAQATQGEAT